VESLPLLALEVSNQFMYLRLGTVVDEIPVFPTELFPIIELNN